MTELREKTARALGFELKYNASGTLCWFDKNSNQVAFWYEHTCGSAAEKWLPDQNAEQAMMCLEWLSNKNSETNIQMDSANKKYRVFSYNNLVRRGERTNLYNKHLPIDVEASTLFEAICKAVIAESEGE